MHTAYMPDQLHTLSILQNLSRRHQVAVDDGSFVSAKSLTRLLALGCKRGQTLRFIAEPETDAVEALDQVILAVQQGLGEEIEALPVTSETPDQLPAQTVISNATTLGNNCSIKWLSFWTCPCD